MGNWRDPGTLIGTFLFLLCSPPLPACPAPCACSAGEVDCTEHELHEVPQHLPANTSTLWLDYNFITILRPGSFLFLPVLLRLSLPHNHLETIHSKALVGLGTLQELDLSNNYLTALTSEAFLPLTSLVTLNLGSNMLGELEPRVLYVLPQLRALFLNSNPWVCTCSIQPLWHWLSHNREKTKEKSLLLCTSPEQLNNYPIMAFRNESFRQCWENSLLVQDYAFFLLIGPFCFLGSIFLCIFTGSVTVACHNLHKESHSWKRFSVCRKH
ncbi:PREDICTED: leucine-rich repeat-containing protein 26 [Tinamus guttatus]|uniref:leucine-rich repeat-containing protein 26 n=1 Tax=Tinamus guttatus TaxID=94827 RepID=UPI00052ED148|nr:PREDICTED: leucine-rich repeat-containing protein 26 [Tinamus guttatus]